MNKKYEISVWRDIFSKEENRWFEEKIIVIGSDTMTSQSRAREPQLVSNVNGTNKFSFTMYYTYIDVETGEKVRNPFIPFLVNERKIKVYWKNKWYDFLIKEIKENSSNHTFTYECEDLYVTELSRSGFGLEFNSELQNNIGTAPELIQQVIDGTDWQFDSDNSDLIYQLTEEPVYEVVTLNSFDAICDQVESNESSSVNIEAGQKILVFYSCAPAAKEDVLQTKLQFYYTTDNNWKQEGSSMLVVNGKCYEVQVTWGEIENNSVTAYVNSTPILTIDFTQGLSQQYRAKRCVDSQKSVFSTVANRYVNVYTKDGKEIYGYSTTEFNDALAVVNIITNSSNYQNAAGWSKENDDNDGLLFRIAPAFNKATDVSTYTAKSYLRFCGEKTYSNQGVQNNASYIKNGFTEGETYIFRYKCIAENDGLPDETLTYIDCDISPIIKSFNEEITYFIYEKIAPTADDESWDGWNEYRLTCLVPCAYGDLITTYSRPILSFKNEESDNIWIEEIQFFKEAYGTRDGEEVRINPNEVDIQSVSNTVYRYFDPEQDATSLKDIEFIDGDDAEPVSNNFEKYGTIEESQSNRFNILQSIAETFECWIRFEILHDDEGYMLYEDGAPCKYIQVKKELGRDTGLTFVYGIDLSDITRTLKSSSIATKTIVQSNENEYGEQGFCTIARSTQNYSRENYILNFDYYIQQGLLDNDTIYEDLYGSDGLYNTLHDNNVQYIENAELLSQKKNDLTKQKAQQTIYNQYLTAAEQEKVSIQDDLIKLAGVTNFSDALIYAQNHLNNKKVQSLVNDYTYIESTINNYSQLYNDITVSVDYLEEAINTYETTQASIIETLTSVNNAFYKKYARFIQEGTWTSEDYYNDDLYYLDALKVAYESSRPQVTYNINVIRVSDLVDFSSKIFQLADIAFIQDTEYFGYVDKFTPYKERVVLTEITSNFDSPEKDSFKVQNYLTQFDDLFQRITAATQNLEFSEGKYARAANIVATDGTIKSSVIQNTFNANADLVYGAQNEAATIDNTGITVTSNEDGSKLVRVTSGGIFVSNDGGETWKNAIRGDGISADVLTAGRINTEQISIYNADTPSFVWDSDGLSAYAQGESNVDTNSKFVRFDQYGIYGLNWDGAEPFKPTSLQDIYNRATFGLTWEKFFLRGEDDNGSIEISSDNDIVIKAGSGANARERLIIGRIDSEDEIAADYGMVIKDDNNNVIFRCDHNDLKIAGWKVNDNCLESSGEDQYTRIYANGSIGSYGYKIISQEENAYATTLLVDILAKNLDNNNSIDLIPANARIYIFNSVIGKMVVQAKVNSNYANSQEEYEFSIPNSLIPHPSTIIEFLYNEQHYELFSLVNVEENYEISWAVNLCRSWYDEQKIIPDDEEIEENLNENEAIEENLNENEEEDLFINPNNYITTYYYSCQFEADFVGNSSLIQIFDIIDENTDIIFASRFVRASDTAWLIDNNGNAIFHNVYLDGGTIGGWWIDDISIYSTKDGSSQKNSVSSDGEIIKDGNIKTQFNSVGIGASDSLNYSIITDALYSSEANIGGLLISNGLVNGYDLASIITRLNNLADNIYPIGSYYMSSDPTSPAELFGGTWEQIKDRFILAAGDSYTVDATGGEATHTLTTDEIPSHYHFSGLWQTVDRYSGGGTLDAAGAFSGYGNTVNTGTAGGGQAHNNMPPYLVAYIWHRVA